mmetsp:Transcript_56777/g.176074  ORF Transcript_56777/g.176074 Transcript_56777/m.176074 type:complete len:216 (+) Transcript_56777:376-1023(+)
MESVPEVVRGYRPKEEPYDARAPGRMEDVQCLKVLGILWMQAVPELCHAERPHTGVAKLHPDYSESVVLRDDPLVHLVDRKAQQLPHVDPDVVLALRPSGRQHEDARALPGSAVAPPGELLVPRLSLVRHAAATQEEIAVSLEPLLVEHLLGGALPAAQSGQQAARGRWLDARGGLRICRGCFCPRWPFSGGRLRTAARCRGCPCRRGRLCSAAR